MTLTEKDNAYIWHPYTQHGLYPYTIPIARGAGAYLFDEQGKKYIDAVSSWWVTIHGHAHPYIAQKVSEQLSTLEQVIFAGFTHKPAIDLAERLLKVIPSNQNKIFYSDNGSTAVEVALKMCIQYWQNKKTERKKIIAFKNAYHGDTFGAMAISERGAFTAPFSNYLFDVIFIEAPTPGSEEKSKLELEIALNENKDVAAFIFEPLIQGSAGMLMHKADVLDQLICICKKNDVLIIADEVMTGFGRTGKLFASDYLIEKPDIVCFSKGLTGGTMPLGITSCTKEIYDSFVSTDRLKTFFHGHSFTANPLACAAALASLDLLLADECRQNIERIVAQHKQFATELKAFKNAANIRQTGTIVAFEVIVNTEQTSYFNNLRDHIYTFFIEKGVLLRPLGNVVYILPPYCISNEDLQYIYKTIKEFLSTLH